MAREAEPESRSGLPYFELTGWTIAIALLVNRIGAWRQRTWDTVLTWQVLALFVAMCVFAASAFVWRKRLLHGLWRCFRVRATFDVGFGWWNDDAPLRVTLDKARAARLARALLAWVLGAGVVIVAITLSFVAHRRYTIAIGLLEACAVYALRRPKSLRASFSFFAVGIVTWAFAAGLTYTNLGDWLLNGATSNLAVVAFVASFGLVLAELCDDRIAPQIRRSFRPMSIAIVLVFVAFASRSDHALDTWVPYHRSFYADIAQLVRDGHLLLWDVPSVYGFLSVEAIALIPARDAWQGLFILTSVVLFVESCIIFTLWRWGRSGPKNIIFAVLMTLATFGENLTRQPYGPRLYPQGGLRFIWVVGLLFVAFLAYVWRDRPRRMRALFVTGNGMWLISLLWSLEAGIWSTVVWLPFTLLTELALGGPFRFERLALANLARRLLARLWPLVCLPLAAFVALDVTYRAIVHHPPDFFAFVEFTGAFVTGAVKAAFPLNPAGAVWPSLILLGAIAAVLIVAIRAAEWTVVPLLAATWLAVWATSTYYAVEPFDGHIELLLVVWITAAAIVTFVSREVLRGERTALLARLSSAPVAILCIATFLGEPAAFASMTFPFMPGWTSDTLQTLPGLPTELVRLMSAAGIEPGDPVLIPNGQYWTEISQGMLFPVARGRDGRAVEYRTWAPLSPLGVEGTILGLPLQRRQLYIDRYLARSHGGGWYVTYREPALCGNISKALITTRTLASPNYSLSLCAFGKRP